MMMMMLLLLNIAVILTSEQNVQSCQVSRISRETPAFERSLPLTRRANKISRIHEVIIVN
jgi:hypothetical protein